MKRVCFASVLCIACLAGGTVSARQQNQTALDLQPQDFAYGLELSVPGGQPFVRFDLPADVLLTTAWADLRDLRVFNAAGEPVPFARIQPPAAAAVRRRVPLQSFRLESSRPGTAPVIELDSRGRGVQLRMVPGGTFQTGTEYLLAVSDPDLQLAIDKLYLDWEEQSVNWQQRVTVSVSSDLDNWRTVAYSRPLMDLKTDEGQRLRHAEIAVSPIQPQSARYWRLHFGTGFAPSLTSVEGEVIPAAVPPPTLELATYGRLAEGGRAVYELSAAQPVTRLRISPRDPNSVLPVLVEGRTENDERWQPIARTVAFRLVQDGQEVFSDPVEIGGRMLKSVRLRPLNASFGSGIPQMAILRDPVTIVLNARGAGPFLLAWGARAADEGSVSIGTLVPNLQSAALIDFPAAQMVSRQELGGPSRLTALAPAERAARWHTTLMWVMLVGGAGVLALLAFRVYQESQESNSSSS